MLVPFAVLVVLLMAYMAMFQATPRREKWVWYGIVLSVLFAVASLFYPTF